MTTMATSAQTFSNPNSSPCYCISTVKQVTSLKLSSIFFFSQYIKAYDDVGDDAGHTDDGGKYW